MWYEYNVYNSYSYFMLRVTTKNINNLLKYIKNTLKYN